MLHLKPIFVANCSAPFFGGGSFDNSLIFFRLFGEERRVTAAVHKPGPSLHSINKIFVRHHIKRCHPHAPFTKLSTTFFSPALSNLMVSLLPSTAVTRP